MQRWQARPSRPAVAHFGSSGVNDQTRRSCNKPYPDMALDIPYSSVRSFHSCNRRGCRSLGRLGPRHGVSKTDHWLKMHEKVRECDFPLKVNLLLSLEEGFQNSNQTGKEKTNLVSKKSA